MICSTTKSDSPVLFDLRPLMPVAGIFNRQFVQAKLFLHGFELGGLRVRKSDPNKAVGLVDEEMNLVNRDIGELAAVLISDTIDEHCGDLPVALCWNPDPRPSWVKPAYRFSILE